MLATWDASVGFALGRGPAAAAAAVGQAFAAPVVASSGAAAVVVVASSRSQVASARHSPEAGQLGPPLATFVAPARSEPSKERTTTNVRTPTQLVLFY